MSEAELHHLVSRCDGRHFAKDISHPQVRYCSYCLLYQITAGNWCAKELVFLHSARLDRFCPATQTGVAPAVDKYGEVAEVPRAQGHREPYTQKCSLPSTGISGRKRRDSTNWIFFAKARQVCSK